MPVNLRALSYLFQRYLLRRRRLTATIPGFGLRLRVRPADVIGRHLYKYQHYEAGTSEALLRHVHFQAGDVVLDVGANIGWYALILERRAGVPLRIFAFEPEPENHALLRENLALNETRMTEALALAVGETSCEQTLYRYGAGNTGRHSMLPLNAGNEIRVPVVSLADFWREKGLADAPLRLIKMDIEGYELAALRGAGPLLGRCEWLLAEYSPGYMRSAGQDPLQLLELLESSGFHAHEVIDGKLQAVGRAGLLASDRHRNLFWRRPSAD